MGSPLDRLSSTAVSTPSPRSCATARRPQHHRLERNADHVRTLVGQDLDKDLLPRKIVFDNQCARGLPARVHLLVLHARVNDILHFAVAHVELAIFPRLSCWIGESLEQPGEEQHVR